MHRRIYEQLTKIKALEQDCSGEAVDYLRTHFFREFYTHTDMKDLVHNLALHEFREKQLLFLQGAPVERYYFLLFGRVILEERFVKPNEKTEKELLDGEGIIGEFFYDLGTRRQRKAETLPSENSTLILSIEKKIFYKICAKQLEEYHQLKEKFSNLSQISKQHLESKGLFKHLGYKRYRIGDWVTSQVLGNEICFILEGECLQSSSKGMITLIQDDCLNLEAYFSKTNKTQFKYRVISSKLHLLTLAFEYVQKLPERFIERLQFLYQNHQNAVKIIKKSFKIHSKSKLQTAPFSTISLKQTQIYSKVKSHISKKSKSFINLQEIQSINSYKNEQSVLSKIQHKVDPLPKVYLRQPKGYFNLQVVSKGKVENQESKRREWASYYHQKSKQKEIKKLKKKRYKYAQKQMLTTSKSNVFFQPLFNKKQMSQKTTAEKEQLSPFKAKIRQKIKYNLHKRH